jgi:hypothetical protein
MMRIRELLDANDDFASYLEPGAYATAFERDLRAAGTLGLWKSEGRQGYQEPGQPAWQAFDAGDYDLTARLIEKRRAELTEHYADLRSAGVRALRRARYVIEPLSDYLQFYELPLLRLRAELGADCNIIVADSDSIRDVVDAVIPGDVLYELDYDQSGGLCGAHRYTERWIVDQARTHIRSAFDSGISIETYCEDNGIG